MKLVAVSQRVDVYPERGERRDALDQRWSQLLDECGITPLPIPNNAKVARSLIESSHCGGVLLTGGGDLVSYGGQSPERDETERVLLDYAIERRLPVLGVCRGMQMIQDFFGVGLHEVSGHVATRHSVQMGGEATEVNSYHRWGATTTVAGLEVMGAAEDGVIEAIRHTSFPIHGIMWHPEREAIFNPDDTSMIRRVFGFSCPLGSCAHIISRKS